jgi:ankyrin repeat protein
MSDNNGETLLHLAVKSGDLNCVKALVAGGASANMQDKNGVTPLHLAAERADLGCIEALMMAKAANAEIPDKNGKSAIDRVFDKVSAVEGEHPEEFTKIVDALLRVKKPIAAEETSQPETKERGVRKGASEESIQKHKDLRKALPTVPSADRDNKLRKSSMSTADATETSPHVVGMMRGKHGGVDQSEIAPTHQAPEPPIRKK